MDNNVNVGGVQPAPVQPSKKSHVGLIIGLVVLLVVLIGGFLAAFFLWIKPTFIDGASSSNNEEEEKTYGEIYGSYLKKNYEDASISFIDFNNDDIPEMIVKEGLYVKEIATINSKNKVESIDVNKDAKLDLLYVVKDEKEKWFLIKEYYSGYEVYDIEKSLKDEKLVTPQTYKTEKELEKEYVSLEADVEYESVDSSSANKTAKSMAKKNKNYTTENTANEIKKDLEEKEKFLNSAHLMHCDGMVANDSVTFDFKFHFNNNTVESLDIVYHYVFNDSLSEDQIKTISNNLKTSLGVSGEPVAKVNGNNLDVTISLTRAETEKLFESDLEKDEFTFEYFNENKDQLMGNGKTCTVE